MSASLGDSVAISSEENLWAALRQALAYKGAGLPFVPDFSSADFARVHFVYEGDKFHSSLTPSAMQGLVQFQASLYRSAAVILKGSTNARHLTNLEKSGLELSFTVGEGSADTEGEGKGFLSNLAGAISTMDSKHKLIAVLVLGLAFFTAGGAKSYLEESGKHESEFIEAERARALLQHDEEHDRTLLEAFKSSKVAAEVRDQSHDAFDSVIKHSGDVSSLTLQGIPLDRDAIDKLRVSTRRVSKNTTYDEDFRIKSVNPSSPEGFELEIESIASQRVFKATLYDSIASDRMRKTIQQAEWKRIPVKLTVTARILGDEVVEARITRASLPKAQPLSVSQAKVYSQRV